MTKLDIATAIAPAMMLAAALSMTISPAPAFAQERQPTTVAVRTSDLNFSDPATRRVLDHRIERAARSACGLDDIRTGTRLGSSDDRACYRQALHATRMQVAEIAENARRGG